MGVVFSGLVGMYALCSVFTSIWQAENACAHRPSDVEILEIYSLSPHLCAPGMRATRDANGSVLHTHFNSGNDGLFRDGWTISWMPENEERNILFESFGIKSKNLSPERSSTLRIEQRTMKGPVWVDSMAADKRRWVAVLNSAMRRRWPFTIAAGVFGVFGYYSADSC